MNRAIVETRIAQTMNIAGLDVSRATSQLRGVIEHRSIGISKRCAGVILLEQLNQFVAVTGRQTVLSEQQTEARSVVPDSIFTLVYRRYDDGNHFTLRAAQWSWPAHQLHVQLVVLPHRPTVNAVNPQNVVVVVDPIIGLNF